MAKALTPLTGYFGGKSGILSKIICAEINKIKHTTYVEGFGGLASVLLRKKPSKIEVYNDVWKILTEFHRVLSKVELYEQFERRVATESYSRHNFDEYLKTWKEQENIIERVAQWFLMQRASFGGNGETFSFVVGLSRRGMAANVSKWLSAIDRLPDVHHRLKTVQVENLPFDKLIPYYDGRDTLFYLDPPYHPDTRSGGKYVNEMTHADHERLVDMLLEIKGGCILSGYAHPVYAPLEEAGWEVQDIQVNLHYYTGKENGQVRHHDKKKRIRTERLWKKKTNPHSVYDLPLFEGLSHE